MAKYVTFSFRENQDEIDSYDFPVKAFSDTPQALGRALDKFDLEHPKARYTSIEIRYPPGLTDA